MAAAGHHLILALHGAITQPGSRVTAAVMATIPSGVIAAVCAGLVCGTLWWRVEAGRSTRDVAIGVYFS